MSDKDDIGVVFIGDPKSLEDVKLIFTYLGPESEVQDFVIEKGIRNLVKAVNLVGVKTIASCEGHIAPHKHPFPWISFDIGSQHNYEYLENMKKFNESIINYRQSDPVGWTIAAGCILRPSIEATSHADLPILRKEADLFAEFLFKNWQRSRSQNANQVPTTAKLRSVASKDKLKISS